MTDSSKLPESAAAALLTRVNELEEEARSLRHELLISRDSIIGLSAEWRTMRAEADEIARTDVGVAYGRVDGLENRLEAALRELQAESIARINAQEELSAANSAHSEMRDALSRSCSALEDEQAELAASRAALIETSANLAATLSSATWRVGSLIVRPSMGRGRR